MSFISPETTIYTTRQGKIPNQKQRFNQPTQEIFSAKKAPIIDTDEKDGQSSYWFGSEQQKAGRSAKVKTPNLFRKLSTFSTEATTNIGRFFGENWDKFIEKKRQFYQTHRQNRINSGQIYSAKQVEKMLESQARFFKRFPDSQIPPLQFTDLFAKGAGISASELNKVRIYMQNKINTGEITPKEFETFKSFAKGQEKKQWMSTNQETNKKTSSLSFAPLYDEANVNVEPARLTKLQLLAMMEDQRILGIYGIGTKPITNLSLVFKEVELLDSLSLSRDEKLQLLVTQIILEAPAPGTLEPDGQADLGIQVVGELPKIFITQYNLDELTKLLEKVSASTTIYTGYGAFVEMEDEAGKYVVRESQIPPHLLGGIVTRLGQMLNNTASNVHQ